MSVPVEQTQNEAFRAAAKLLEFSRQLSDLTLHKEGQRQGPYRRALGLVKDLDRPLFEKAVVELRVTFLTIDQGRDPRGSTDVSGIEINTETFLEWLTRLDLHHLHIQEGIPESELLKNRERWLLLDLAFGDAENFWTSFRRLQGIR